MHLRRFLPLLLLHFLLLGGCDSSPDNKFKSACMRWGNSDAQAETLCGCQLDGLKQAIFEGEIDQLADAMDDISDKANGNQNAAFIEVQSRLGARSLVSEKVSNQFIVVRRECRLRTMQGTVERVCMRTAAGANAQRRCTCLAGRLRTQLSEQEMLQLGFALEDVEIATKAAPELVGQEVDRRIEAGTLTSSSVSGKFVQMSRFCGVSMVAP